jgi:hypothetical protein
MMVIRTELTAVRIANVLIRFIKYKNPDMPA